MNTIVQMEPWFDENETRATTQYLQSGGWVTEFQKTQELEAMIARFLGVKYCVMTVNGTVSLIMALLAMGLKAGDSVLVPNLTMIASPNACALLGITPILVDVMKETLCMDLQQAKKALRPTTKALMYVALNGRSEDMREVRSFCKEHGLLLLEDSAQALGSTFQGRPLGTFGEVGSFSFSTQKVITTGQGGALVTNSKHLNTKLRHIKDFGRIRGGVDIHDHWGWNFKFTDLQAVVGIEQMRKLPWRLKRKKEIYRRYYHGLRDIAQITFIPTDLNQVSPWFIDIYVPKPDHLAQFLKKYGIGSRRIYPSIASQKIYKKQYRGNRFPVSEYYSGRGLWLPSSSKLTNEQIDYITKTIRIYFSHTS